MVLRLWHGAIAVLVLAALALQVGIAVRVPGHPANVEPGILRGASLPGRVIRVFSFFTVEANILSAITSAQLSRRPDREGSVWRVLRLNALVGIAVTGVVYSTVLARVHQPHGWAEVSTNTIFHYIVPIMMVVGWLVLGPRPRINAGIVGWSLVFPRCGSSTPSGGERSGIGIPTRFSRSRRTATPPSWSTPSSSHWCSPR